MRLNPTGAYWEDHDTGGGMYQERSGAGYFYTRTTVLALDVISFDGYNSGRANCLFWKVSNQYIGADFTLQRSTNGVDYIDLATLQRVPPRKLATPYSYCDHTPAKGVNYYRLRVGDQLHPKVVVLRNDVQRMHEPALFPNPTTGAVDLHMDIPSPTTVEIVVCNSLGERLLHQQLLGQVGILHHRIDLRQWPSGVYFITIEMDAQLYYRAVWKI